MQHPPYLDKRDFSGGDSTWTFTVPKSTGIPLLDAALYDISNRHSNDHNPEILLQLLSTSIQAASSDISEHDLEVMNRTLAEMFHANLAFTPYRHIRKISIFGSARIKAGEPSYIVARDFSKLATEHGYMTITGGGPGIMQACNEGAGADNSFGLNITLPFEQEANPVMQGNPRLINFYYFYIRKLNFVSESDALVAFPGGFGTMDEIFETITLIQTGKATIYPVILLDAPGKTFWKQWIAFIRTELVDSHLISPEDLSFLFVTQNPQEAIEHIDRFYHLFHSYRFVGDMISIRLTSSLSVEAIAKLQHDFADLVKDGCIVQRGPLAEENDEPLIADLPRLVFHLKRGNYGRLRQFIDAINDAE